MKEINIFVEGFYYCCCLNLKSRPFSQRSLKYVHFFAITVNIPRLQRIIGILFVVVAVVFVCFFFFNWSIVALQSCVDFHCTGK